MTGATASLGYSQAPEVHKTSLTKQILTVMCTDPAEISNTIGHKGDGSQLCCSSSECNTTCTETRLYWQVHMAE